MVERLFMPGKPCLYLLQSDVDVFENLALHLASERPQRVIRFIRGKKSQDVDSFFNEVGAALQFPYYFGENWAAFDECITDLDWLEGESYLLMVTHAVSFLRDAHPEDFKTCLRIMNKANEEWLTPNEHIPHYRQPTPFHVVFQCTANEIDAFSARLEIAQAEYERL